MCRNDDDITNRRDVACRVSAMNRQNPHGNAALHEDVASYGDAACHVSTTETN